MFFEHNGRHTLDRVLKHNAKRSYNPRNDLTDEQANGHGPIGDLQQIGKPSGHQQPRDEYDGYGGEQARQVFPANQIDQRGSQQPHNQAAYDIEYPKAAQYKVGE